MSTSANDLMQLAALLEDGDSEVSWRGAVSRAYYASYHGCHAWHVAQGAPGSASGHPGGVHQKLFNQLKNGAPEWPEQQRALGRILSYKLAALHIRRVVADYDTGCEFTQAVARTDCATARILFTRL